MDDRLELDTGELKGISERRSQRWWKQRYNLGNIARKAKEMQKIEGVERKHEEAKEMYGEENIISAVQ